MRIPTNGWLLADVFAIRKGPLGYHESSDSSFGLLIRWHGELFLAPRPEVFRYVGNSEHNRRPKDPGPSDQAERGASALPFG